MVNFLYNNFFISLFFSNSGKYIKINKKSASVSEKKTGLKFGFGITIISVFIQIIFQNKFFRNFIFSNANLVILFFYIICNSLH